MRLIEKNNISDSDDSYFCRYLNRFLTIRKQFPNKLELYANGDDPAIRSTLIADVAQAQG
jgi:hypothetical protein